MSVFSSIPPETWLLENEHAFAVFDNYPVSSGHVLIITKRIVPTWFEASDEEQASLMVLVNQIKQYLDSTLVPRPDGYNVGFNAGPAAGQTVMHVHIHVIPRYIGDIVDPRGGVRHVIPSKGNYLAPECMQVLQRNDVSMLKLVTGHPHLKLWDQLSTRMIGASCVEILTSFVQNSGLDVIETQIFQLLRGPASIRILVSDYLSISDPAAIKRLFDWQQLIADDYEYQGELTVRLVEVEKLPEQPESFHPKSWRITDSRQSFIVVGSSNLSRPGLETGVEWNLLSTTSNHSTVHTAFANEFERLWTHASILTNEVVSAYATRAILHRKTYFEPEYLDDRFVPEPRPWQLKALRSLQEIRDAGYKRALVAVATGMGKTWLSAFDAKNIGMEIGRFPRVIVIAHRSHLLAQCESSLSAILERSFGPAKTSWYVGLRSEFDGMLVLASIQKLSRTEGLKHLSNETFDYAIIDEVHHAHAPSYRRVLAHLNAKFVLGLTATPERGDGIDAVSIFDDNLAHQATIGDGIAEESLVPFHYIGIRDTVDFQQIPWRNGRFDPEELEKRVAESERMQRLWNTMQKHPGKRTLVFCCSRRHAGFVRDWFRGKGLSSSAVFSGEGSDGQIESLEALREGRLQSLCVVDMFNEGLDIPEIDRVVMLRPTESKVVFLQQLGRGLRASEGKTRLLVIDFVGNHRIFSQRILHLLSLTGKDARWSELKLWLEGQTPTLPPGCLLEMDVEAKDVIGQFIPSGSQVGLETYRAMRDYLGRRPTAVELFGREILPRTVSQAAGSWFDFCDSEKDLDPREFVVLERFRAWLMTVETTSLNKSYKMVVLRVLIDSGALFQSVQIQNFSARCRQFMLQHSVLRGDLFEGKHAIDHETATDEQWAKWWKQWPIDRWLDNQKGERWFEMLSNSFRLKIDCPEDLQTTFESMTNEIVEWRLAAYSKSHRLIPSLDSSIEFEAKVSHSGRRTILFLPEKSKVPSRPVGLVNVRLPDQSHWEFKFVKVACNVAKPVGGTENELDHLLKSWFGESAGLPGTNFKVRFQLKHGQWELYPIRSTEKKGFNEAAIRKSRKGQS